MADDERLQPEEKREKEDLQAAFADAGSPMRRAFEPAERASAIPAKSRNSGAPKPPRISDQPNQDELRSAVRVQLSITCASIMISTAMPRIRSRYVRRPRGAIMRLV